MYQLPRRVTSQEERQLLQQQRKVARLEAERQRLEDLVAELRAGGCRASDLGEVLGVARETIYGMERRARDRQ